MNITPMLLALNYRKGRRAKAEMIVIHVTQGGAASVISWFHDPEAKVSAHYMVEMNGTIVQFVREEDEAWAQGRVDHPSAAVVKERPTVNPNAYCISIEHEGDGRHELTVAQRASSIALIRDIAARHGIPIDRRHIVGHHEIFAPKSCPGAINVDNLVRDSARADFSDVAGGSSSTAPTTHSE